MRAAQYVRMSTEHQKYSTENQAEIIARYAAARGIEIVKTYADEGKSGLNLEGRDSLQRLIHDVTSGQADFSVILAYDVSGWGRFQDADQSAYYEFVCRKAGVAEDNGVFLDAYPRKSSSDRGKGTGTLQARGPSEKPSRGADQGRWREWRRTRSRPARPAAIRPAARWPKRLSRRSGVPGRREARRLARLRSRLDWIRRNWPVIAYWIWGEVPCVGAEVGGFGCTGGGVSLLVLAASLAAFAASSAPRHSGERASMWLTMQ